MLLCCLLTPSAAVATAHASVAGALAVGGLSGVGRNLMRMVLNHQKKSPHERRRHLNPEFYTPNPQPQTLNHRRSVVGRSSRRCAIAIRPALVRPPVALYAELISTLSSACTALTCGAPAVGVRILTKMDLQATRALPSAELKSMIEGSASMASG